MKVSVSIDGGTMRKLDDTLDVLRGMYLRGERWSVEQEARLNSKLAVGLEHIVRRYARFGVPLSKIGERR